MNQVPLLFFVKTFQSEQSRSDNHTENEKENLFNLISDARDEIDALKEQIIVKQNKLASDTNKSNQAKANYNVA